MIDSSTLFTSTVSTHRQSNEKENLRLDTDSTRLTWPELWFRTASLLLYKLVRVRSSRDQFFFRWVWFHRWQGGYLIQHLTFGVHCMFCTVLYCTYLPVGMNGWINTVWSTGMMMGR